MEQDEVPCSNANEGYAACGFDLADGVVDEDVLNSCTVCDSDTTMRCSVCGTPYCNPQCLMKDWPHHKTLCKTARDEPAANEANTVRAILFPMDSAQPRWIRINLKTLDLSIVRALGITERKPLKKPANKLLATHLNKTLKHRKIGHGIRQFTAPRARIDPDDTDNNLNQSVFALADPGSLRPYFGSAHAAMKTPRPATCA
ncbi:hypothetical protein NPX13_g3658 [Xylaria arbuscula]|uniref:MYND-type domain-containing protein n=1 Tax=Xylaria arbuscula TaxID=114810 RepID=A0A9W8TP40_9PEZI|nr:hypothetical protein NPX13_g3658 [Xylaria arbuscula]